MARPAGFEPAANSLEGYCSIRAELRARGRMLTQQVSGFQLGPGSILDTLHSVPCLCTITQWGANISMARGWRTFSCLVLIAALYLSGCSSQVSREPVPAPPVDTAEQANEILFNALGLVGTPYLYGGNNPQSGFDCSGLINYVYRESANIALPRTVVEMSQLSAPDVAEDNLQSGDLVIFATGGGTRPSHAGIYVGDGRFVHAPSRGGEVRMDFLSDSYWQRSYLNAKRPLAAR